MLSEIQISELVEGVFIEKNPHNIPIMLLTFYKKNILVFVFCDIYLMNKESHWLHVSATKLFG